MEVVSFHRLKLKRGFFFCFVFLYGWFGALRDSHHCVTMASTPGGMDVLLVEVGEVQEQLFVDTWSSCSRDGEDASRLVILHTNTHTHTHKQHIHEISKTNKILVILH